MFLEVHKIATGVLGRPFVAVTEYGVNTLLRFIHMLSLANAGADGCLGVFPRILAQPNVRILVNPFCEFSKLPREVFQ
ncbi:MAG: hypothetical protein A2V57_00130 [Candidatus Aminicenantes bacterium RBG_19FT_COMBO_65_30]|nr:MAG: hypothetical protein A2V57_00130 [Candidatus Aminicenantes bacterium RBG_19FT_COMBO_65_30]